MPQRTTTTRAGRAVSAGTVTVGRSRPLVAPVRRRPLRRRAQPAGPRPGYGQDYLRTEFCASLRALGAL